MIRQTTPPGQQALKSRLIRGSIWAFGGQAITVIAALAANVFLARLLAPNEMGLYFLAFSLASSAAIVAQLGLNRTVVRLVAESIGADNPGRALAAVRKIFRLAILGACVVAGLLFTGIGEWLALNIFNSAMLAKALVPIALWVIVISVRSLQAETFRGFHDIRSATVFGDALSRTVLVVMLAAHWITRGSATLDEALWLSIGAATISGIFAAVRLRQRINQLKVGAATDSTAGTVRLPVLQILSISWPLLVTGLTIFLLTQIDLWVIGAYRPHEELAIYGVAARLVLFVAMPIFILNSVVAPTIAELYAQGRKEELEGILRASATLASVPSFVVLLAFILAGDRILTLIYGSYYQQATGILTWLCFGQLSNVWAGSCGIVLMMTGHQATMMRITALSGLMVLAGDLYFVRLYGITGVAVVTVVGMTLQNLLLLILTRKNTGIWTQVQLSLLRPSVVSRWLRRR
jgi:O-antigen/teichoic acid export membrane protein